MAKHKNLSNGSNELQTGDLRIIVEITGLKYDTVQKVVAGLRNNKKVTKAMQLLPLERTEMIKRIKAQLV